VPQFDFANVFVPQLVWLFVFFAILYFGIVQMTLPKVGSVMGAREDKVNGDIAAAESAKMTSDKLADDYAAGLDAAHKAARAKIGEAQAAAAANVEKALAKTDAALAEKLAAADAALATSRGKALAEVDTVASEAAADIVERLTGKRPASGVLSKAVNTVMAN
jgi:F-type H+-transporting ATPase subunit b